MKKVTIKAADTKPENDRAKKLYRYVTTRTYWYWYGCKGFRPPAKCHSVPQGGPQSSEHVSSPISFSLIKFSPFPLEGMIAYRPYRLQDKAS